MDTPHGPPGGHDTPVAASEPPVERRRNARLRELVDEMLASIRVAANADLWTPEERASYEADMARIMETVRQQAFERGHPRARLD
jgi:hypothetical protein